MLTDDQREYIRRSYYIDGKSLRHIARKLNMSRDAVTKAVRPLPFVTPRPKVARDWPVLGPYQSRIDALME